MSEDTRSPVERKLDQMNQRLVAYEAGKLAKHDTNGHDRTKYEIESLKQEIESAKAYLAERSSRKEL